MIRILVAGFMDCVACPSGGIWLPSFSLFSIAFTFDLRTAGSSCSGPHGTVRTSSARSVFESPAELIESPCAAAKKNDHGIEEKCGNYALGSETVINQIHRPRWAGVDRSRLLHPNVISHARFVNDSLDSAVEKLGELQDSAAIQSPGQSRHFAALTKFQDQQCRLRRMPQRGRNSIRRDGIDHRRSFACDQPVRPGYSFMRPAAKGSNIQRADRSGSQ